jgi:hypothetical protein
MTRSSTEHDTTALSLRDCAAGDPDLLWASTRAVDLEQITGAGISCGWCPASLCSQGCYLR